MFVRLKPVKILATVYFWLMATIGMILTFIVCIICYPFVNQKTFARIYEYIFCSFTLKAMTLSGIWSVKFSDLRTDKTWNKRYIVIPNHASFIDTLLTGLIPIKKKFIIARIFTFVPLFNWLCINSGHVPFDKKDKDNGIRSALERSEDAMKDGCSFAIYPEGKRSSDSDTLLPFKSGPFILSLKTGVPLLPVVLKGTGVGMKIGGVCKPANLEIVIGDPIEIVDGNIEEAIEKSRTFIQKHLNFRIN